MAEKNNFIDLLAIDESGQEVVVVERNIAEDGDMMSFSWLFAESIIDEPLKHTGKWAEYIQKWQSEGRI